MQCFMHTCFLPLSLIDNNMTRAISWQMLLCYRIWWTTNITNNNKNNHIQTYVLIIDTISYIHTYIHTNIQVYIRHIEIILQNLNYRACLLQIFLSNFFLLLDIQVTLPLGTSSERFVDPQSSSSINILQQCPNLTISIIFRRISISRIHSNTYSMYIYVCIYIFMYVLYCIVLYCM